MPRPFRYAAPLLALAAAAPIARADDAQGPLAPLAFMSGCWRNGGEGGRAVIEESYTAADADVMLGTTRYLRGGRVTGFEFSRLHADSSGVFLTPYPDGKSSVSFRLVRSAPREAVFENLAHDFPQRIIYQSPAADSLRATIEGGGRSMSWHMAAHPCGQG